MKEFKMTVELTLKIGGLYCDGIMAPFVLTSVRKAPNTKDKYFVYGRFIGVKENDNKPVNINAEPKTKAEILYKFANIKYYGEVINEPQTK